MHTLYLNTQQYQLPSKWEELTKRQLITVAWLTMTAGSAVTMAKLMFLVLTQSLGWWQRQRIRFFYFFQASVDERADMIFLTRSFSESRGFTDQKIKKIGGKNVLFGPSSALANMTLWEYIRAEQAFLQYLKSNNPDHLDKLIAIMYRPARADYDPNIHEDPRVPLIDASVSARIKQIQSIKRPVKIAILMWFDGCRSHMIKIFPLIFRKEDSPLNDKLKAGTTNPSTSGGWLDLITSLASDMTQFEKIGNTNLTVAFTDLSNRIKQSRKKKK